MTQMLFVVGSVETTEILPLLFYLPELDLLQWQHEAILSSELCVCLGLHCPSEEPLISPCQCDGSSKISQHAIRLAKVAVGAV